MNKNLKVKTIVIVATLLVFLWGIFLGKDPQASVEAMRKASAERGIGAAVLAGIQENIHLGLDLKGGIHLILQVMVDEAVKEDVQRSVERMQAQLRAKNYNSAEATLAADRSDRIVVHGVTPEQAQSLRDLAGEQFAEYDVSSSPEGDLLLTMKPSIVRDTKQRAVAQSMETIRGRVDELGVAEPIIEEHGLGENQILVQLPGISDVNRVMGIIQSTAKLEIKEAFSLQGYNTPQEAAASVDNMVGKVVLQGTSSGGSAEQYFVVAQNSVVAGRDLRRAETGNDQTGRPEVKFLLTSEAGKRFGQFTATHLQKPLAIVVGDRVKEVANIEGEIHDEGSIHGGFTDQSAKDLALVLNSGSLPASIHFLENRTVSASLGHDSIRQGVTAAVVGMLLVMVFMLIYYRGAGINADLALVLNLVILLGFMGFSGQVLTLPGIAGVILTVGMGVDSNVLIFERIREELRLGKVPAQAVDQGFGRAWLTIVDTHITTIVSAAILFVFGSGPVRGFAVTLVIGLLANLFTAVFVSRVIFDSHLKNKARGEAISI